MTSSGEQGATTNLLAFPTRIRCDRHFARTAAPDERTISTLTFLLLDNQLFGQLSLPATPQSHTPARFAMSPLPHASRQCRPPVYRFTLTFKWIACSLFVLLGLGIYQSMQASKKFPAPNQIHALSTSTPPNLVKGYGKLPLSFEANQGQTSAPVRFLARGRGYACSSLVTRRCWRCASRAWRRAARPQPAA